ncbi:uncharacterized protein J3R85_017507 [Psidium guajava]|nr:uncharacterized protein J3R85_017507 [Psidium guajava]
MPSVFVPYLPESTPPKPTKKENAVRIVTSQELVKRRNRE